MYFPCLFFTKRAGDFCAAPPLTSPKGRNCSPKHFYLSASPIGGKSRRGRGLGELEGAVPHSMLSRTGEKRANPSAAHSRLRESATGHSAKLSRTRERSIEHTERHSRIRECLSALSGSVSRTGESNFDPSERLSQLRESSAEPSGTVSQSRESLYMYTIYYSYIF